MSKLQKFYVSQCSSAPALDGVPHSNGTPSPDQLRSLSSAANGKHEVLEVAASPGEIESLLATMKEEAETSFTELKEKIKIALHQQKHTAQEVRHLRRSLSELRQALAPSCDLAKELEPTLASLEHHVGVLSRMYVES